MDTAKIVWETQTQDNQESDQIEEQSIILWGYFGERTLVKCNCMGYDRFLSFSNVSFNCWLILLKDSWNRRKLNWGAWFQVAK